MEQSLNTLALIKSRRSLRAFSDRTVSNETLSIIFEAARWAASSRNEQPWQFLLTGRHQPEAYRNLLACLNPRNQEWAHHAPVLILVTASRTFSRNHSPNRYAWHDVGQAVSNLSIQATAMGLALHQMAGFDSEQARKIFSIPDSHEPVTVIALGYPGDPAILSEPMREREIAPRQRKPLNEIVFDGKWGSDFKTST